MKHLHNFIRSQCAAYFGDGPYGQKHFCVRRDGACKLYGEAPACCRYLEEAVLPADHQGSAKTEYLEAFNDPTRPLIARYSKRATCAYCKTPFTATHNREMYCSKECREAARRAQVRKAVRRHRSPTAEQGAV